LTETSVTCNIRFRSERRDELIAKALDDFLEHGLAGLSLRPLARRIGTSARLLVYHFGSKDGLVTAVMDEVRARTQASFAAFSSRPGRRNGKDVMLAFWGWMIHPANLRYVHLLFEVQVLALKEPRVYARYLKGTSSSWLKLISGALPASKDARVVATLCAAVMDGLLLEVLSTGDRRRATLALAAFDRMLGARRHHA
jgi:AcrR family transcriptional regulator